MVENNIILEEKYHASLANIQSFLFVFRSLLDLPEEIFQKNFIIENTFYLNDIIEQLLFLLLNRKKYIINWEKHLSKSIDSFGTINPLKDTSFNDLSISVQMKIVSDLCDWTVQESVIVRDYIRELDPLSLNQIKIQPLSYDITNSSYWQFDPESLLIYQLIALYCNQHLNKRTNHFKCSSCSFQWIMISDSLDSLSALISTLLDEYKYLSDIDGYNNLNNNYEDPNCCLCHSSRDPSKTLLCDLCDAPYHLYCLSPPLNSIPESDWFCKKCQNSLESPQNHIDDYQLTLSSPTCLDLCQDKPLNISLKRKAIFQSFSQNFQNRILHQQKILCDKLQTIKDQYIILEERKSLIVKKRAREEIFMDNIIETRRERKKVNYSDFYYDEKFDSVFEEYEQESPPESPESESFSDDFDIEDEESDYYD